MASALGDVEPDYTSQIIMGEIPRALLDPTLEETQMLASSHITLVRYLM